MDGIPLGWQQIGAIGLVTLFVLLMWTDRIITRDRHVEIVSILRERIAERDAHILKLEKQRDDALTLATTTANTNAQLAAQKDAALVAMQAVAKAAESSGGDP